ncbi:MAG: hypothetical protein AAF462_05755, partial [Thermodesulfobacteriota bacterium]
TQTKSWNQGQGSECTTGSTETISGNESISLAVGSGILSEFTGTGTRISVGFEFGQSRAINTNTTTTSTTTNSVGIEVNKPDEFLNPDVYRYLVNSFILGQPFPDGVWQSLFSDGPTENIVYTGPLITAFTGNMLSNDSGNFWEAGGVNPYLMYPDIGLNFPTRWEVVPTVATSMARQPSYCRRQSANSAALLCTFIRKPAENENELWVNSFYNMRGLFIQSGDEPIGPSQTFVYMGDDIHLSTRVYNLSLTALDPSDKVHVAFYRMEWDNTLNVPLGESILIDEQIVERVIPPFTSSDAPNWTLVTTTFNTAEEDMGPDKYWVFWVLVYPVDDEGNLVEELPGYGLDSSNFTPGEEFKSILDVPLEMVTVEEFDEDVVRSFTNNVGFYKNAIYVSELPLNSEAEQDSTILIDNLSVTPEQVFVGEDVIIDGDVYSLDASTDGVVVLFHDRHPDEADKAFDIELISNIRADGLNNVKVMFKPEFCGEYELFVSARDKGNSNIGADLLSVVLDVICQPGDTNLDGQLIGENGKPVGTGGNGNCSLAQAGSRAEVPLYLIVPLLFVAVRLGYRRINQ